MILFYKKDTSLGCQQGWTGDNCDSCTPNFEPDGECSRCRTGWTGQNCDECVTNFESPGLCDQFLREWAGDNCSICATNLGPSGDCNECLRGWTGRNCSECATNFGSPGQCNSCLVGWAGDNCDACAPRWTGSKCVACKEFGFSAEIGCTECIVNGVLRGTSLYVDVNYNITIHLTFTGSDCLDVAPGKKYASDLIKQLAMHIPKVSL